MLLLDSLKQRGDRMFATDDETGIPVPPSEAEKYAYINPDSLGLAISTLALAIAFSWGSFLFLQDKPFLLTAIYGLFAGLVCLGLYGSVLLYLLARRLDPHWWDYKKGWTYKEANRYPTVDIFLPNCGEDLSLLASNLYHVSRIDYPAFKVWVLDDAARPEVASIARRHGFEYIAREGSEWKKSGNMRNCFAQSDGELILVLDADFAPHPSILSELSWLFLDKPELGIVQTPHYFRVNKHDNALQRGGGQLQSPFFRIIQNARDAVGRGSAICCGSNAIYRRKALEPAGGSACVPRSEDVATGLSVIAAGYTIKYVPLCLASGLSPSTLRAYINMLSRWCGGAFDIRFSRYLWQRGVPGPTRLAYMGSALSFFIIGFGIIGYATPGLVNLLAYPESLSWHNYTVIVPAIAVLAIVRSRWAFEPWDLSLFYATFITSYTSLIAIIDYFRGANVPWIATGQKRSKGGSYGRVLWAIQWIPTIGFGLCLAGIYKNWELIPAYAWVPTTTFWGLKFWCSRLVLKQHEAETQTEATIKAIGELARETKMKHILNENV